MRISRRGVLRVLGLIALAVLVQAQGAGFLIEATRDSRDCVQACNNIRLLCKDACQEDCDALFPPGDERNACKSACAEGCADESKECKAKCQPGDEPSPTEP